MTKPPYGTPTATLTAAPSAAAHVDEHLSDAALHRLSPAAQATVHAHLTSCRRCRDRFTALHESLAELSLAQPRAVPSRALRDNLLAGIDRAAAVPYPGFARRLGRMYQLDEQQTLELLRMSADPQRWEDQGLISLLHFSAGPALPGTHAGFMRLAPGVRFPRHRHVGQELMLMLSGTLKEEDSGAIYHPGDSLHSDPGSEHAFSILPPHDGVFAILLYESWPLFTGT